MKKKKRFLILILIFLSACGKGGIELLDQSSKFQQGQAKWVTDESNEKTEKATKADYQRLNLQQVVAELQIIPTVSYTAVRSQEATLGKTVAAVSQTTEKISSIQGSTSEQILSEIHSLRMRQEAYQVPHLKKYVDQLKVEDRKISTTVQLAGKTIFLQNESEKLIRVFRALANLDGRVQVPLYDTSAKKVEKIIEIPVGGVLNDLARKLVQKSKIEQCRQVLCALTELMYTDTSEDIVSSEKMNPAESAAYQLIFNALYHRYLIPFYVPKLPMFQEAAYQINLKRFEVFNSDQVNLISEALWKLPPTFDQMPALLYFLADNQSVLLGSVRDNSAVQTVSLSTIGHHISVYNNRPDNLYERWGFVVIENKNWGRYLNDFTVRFSSGTRNLTLDELKIFEPDIRDRIKRKHLDVVIHELAHALDFSRVAPYSLGSEWFNLSGWRFNSADQTRQLRTYSRLFPDILDTAVTVVNQWIHSESSQFINSYAQTSPVEDFAVHLAGQVQFPREVMSLTSGKARFLNQNVFSGVYNRTPFHFQYQRESRIADLYSSRSDLLSSRMYRSLKNKCFAYYFETQKWAEVALSACPLATQDNSSSKPQ